MTTHPKTRPIILHPEEVRAALDGRLSMLWRPVKKQPVGAPTVITCDWMDDITQYGFCDPFNAFVSPFGGPGTILWGQETWYNDVPESQELEHIEYRADHNCNDWEDGCPCRHEGRSSWRPSSNMSFRACRPELRHLEVTGVEARRVQSISRDEALAAGVDLFRELFRGLNTSDKALRLFPKFWDTSIAKRPEHKWAENPLAWAATIRRKT